MGSHSYQIGQISVPIKKSQRLENKNTSPSFFYAFLSLLKGMKVTLKYFLSPREIVTDPYPENKKTLKITERFRAELKLKKDSRGFLNCTGCKICAQHCPNASIEVIEMRGLSGKKEIDRYIWRMDSCTFCNICVQVCPFDALEMKPNFESSTLDRRLFVYQLNHYAGPTKKNLDKLENEDEKKRLVSLIPREPYRAPVPLGVDQGVDSLKVLQKQKASLEKNPGDLK